MVKLQNIKSQLHFFVFDNKILGIITKIDIGNVYTIISVLASAPKNTNQLGYRKKKFWFISGIQNMLVYSS